MTYSLHVVPYAIGSRLRKKTLCLDAPTLEDHLENIRRSLLEIGFEESAVEDTLIALTLHMNEVTLISPVAQPERCVAMIIGDNLSCEVARQALKDALGAWIDAR